MRPLVAGLATGLPLDAVAAFRQYAPTSVAVPVWLQFALLVVRTFSSGGSYP
jgi:hypothetical protein